MIKTKAAAYRQYKKALSDPFQPIPTPSTEDAGLTAIRHLSRLETSGALRQRFTETYVQPADRDTGHAQVVRHIDHQKTRLENNLITFFSDNKEQLRNKYHRDHDKLLLSQIHPKLYTSSRKYSSSRQTRKSALRDSRNTKRNGARNVPIKPLDYLQNTCIQTSECNLDIGLRLAMYEFVAEYAFLLRQLPVQNFIACCNDNEFFFVAFNMWYMWYTEGKPRGLSIKNLILCLRYHMEVPRTTSDDHYVTGHKTHIDMFIHHTVFFRRIHTQMKILLESLDTDILRFMTQYTFDKRIMMINNRLEVDGVAYAAYECAVRCDSFDTVDIAIEEMKRML